MYPHRGCSRNCKRRSFFNCHLQRLLLGRRRDARAVSQETCRHSRLNFRAGCAAVRFTRVAADEQPIGSCRRRPGFQSAP